jgi:hypothetical protein
MSDWAMGWMEDWDSIPGRGKRILSSPRRQRTCRGPTKPPIQRIQRALSPGVKRPGPEADYSPPSSAEVKNGGAIFCTSHASSWCSV